MEINHSLVDIAEFTKNKYDIVLSPADRTYLDMKYDTSTERGLNWAGSTSVKDTYNWEPSECIESIDEPDILGVESAVWTETIENLEDIEYMLFPRMPAVAERGWTPATETDWNDFRCRLAFQALRWKQTGINYYQSPEIDWFDTFTSG